MMFDPVLLLLCLYRAGAGFALAGAIINRCSSGSWKAEGFSPSTFA
jgi:hypothetical protein